MTRHCRRSSSRSPDAVPARRSTAGTARGPPRTRAPGRGRSGATLSAVNPLSYGVLCSLDGYVEDTGGGFDWAAPDEEVHAFVNEQERAVSTYLYGRRLYETMRFWQTAGGDPADHPVEKEYAEVWRAADKVVFSRTLP